MNRDGAVVRDSAAGRATSPLTSNGAPRQCIVCREMPREQFLLSNGKPLLQCQNCGLAWWDWPPFDPGEFYDEGYFQSAKSAKGYDDYAALEPGIRRTATGRLKRIAKLLKRLDRSKDILDIGCGTGLFLDEARRAGWLARGIEVSAFAAETGRRRGLEIECRPIEGMHLPRHAFDCVTLWDVIEHVRDPAGVLRSAVAALRPGGVLAVSTGDVTSFCARLSGSKWHLFNLPEHLFFFSPLALRRLIETAGCTVRGTTNELLWVPVAYLTERLGKTLLRRSQSARNAKASRTGWIGRRVVPATLGDVMGFYATRGAAND